MGKSTGGPGGGGRGRRTMPEGSGEYWSQGAWLEAWWGGCRVVGGKGWEGWGPAAARGGEELALRGPEGEWQSGGEGDYVED